MKALPWNSAPFFANAFFQLVSLESGVLCLSFDTVFFLISEAFQEFPDFSLWGDRGKFQGVIHAAAAAPLLATRHGELFVPSVRFVERLPKAPP